jgi:hypothetical protein
VGLLWIWALAATRPPTRLLRAANSVADLRTTAVDAVRQTVNMPAPTMPPQALVMPEQLFLAPVRRREEGEIIDV